MSALASGGTAETRAQAASAPLPGTTAAACFYSILANQVCQKGTGFVLPRNRCHPQPPASDKQDVKRNKLGLRSRPPMNVPWAMQMKAVSTEEPSRLVQSLTGAILGCGGWVLSRGAINTGKVNM